MLREERGGENYAMNYKTGEYRALLEQDVSSLERGWGVGLERA